MIWQFFGDTLDKLNGASDRVFDSVESGKNSHTSAKDCHSHDNGTEMSKSSENAGSVELQDKDNAGAVETMQMPTTAASVVHKNLLRFDITGTENEKEAVFSTMATR